MNSTQEQIEQFLNDKNNKKYHFNNFEELNYKIPSGSLNLDIAMGGGLTSGAHRFTGVNEGGKTSCALSFAKNFQDHFGEKAMVVVVKSEGRLSQNVLERSGVDTDPNRFFIFDCNVFEKVFELVRNLVMENKDESNQSRNVRQWRERAATSMEILGNLGSRLRGVHER